MKTSTTSVLKEFIGDYLSEQVASNPQHELLEPIINKTLGRTGMADYLIRKGHVTHVTNIPLLAELLADFLHIHRNDEIEVVDNTFTVIDLVFTFKPL